MLLLPQPTAMSVEISTLDFFFFFKRTIRVAILHFKVADNSARMMINKCATWNKLKRLAQKRSEWWRLVCVYGSWEEGGGIHYVSRQILKGNDDQLICKLGNHKPGGNVTIIMVYAIIK